MHYSTRSDKNDNNTTAELLITINFYSKGSRYLPHKEIVVWGKEPLSEAKIERHVLVFLLFINILSASLCNLLLFSESHLYWHRDQPLLAFIRVVT